MSYLKSFRICSALLCTALLFLSPAKVSKGDFVLDAFGGVDPTTHQDWSDAGVLGDTSTYAGGTITADGGVFNISGGLTASVLEETNIFNGGQFGSNNLLNDYIFVQSGTATVSLGGFENTLTSTLGDMAGNTFTMLPNTDYTLYLFGAGDSNGQDTTFTFDGVSKTTSNLIVGTAPDAGHAVTFDFTTPVDLAGFTIDFTYQNNSSDFGAWNGAAITSAAVPEPSSLGLLLSVGVTGLVYRRRQK